MNKELYQAELERYRKWYKNSPEFVIKLIKKKVAELKEKYEKINEKITS